METSELKACLVDDQQDIVASASVKLKISRPKPLWSEQAPQAWILAMHEAIDILRKQHRKVFAAVRGIGISGQMHGATLLDKADEVLGPAILWNDTRSYAECAELEKAVPQASQITGNRIMPGFTAPKLQWLRHNDPVLFSRIATVMLPKDYLVFHLTGERVTEMSDAAGTSWLDVSLRDWSDLMLNATGLTRDRVPRLLEGTQPAGALRTELQQRWGIAQRVVVAAGAGDNAAAGVGVGAVADGQGFVSLGSSGVIFVATERFAPNPEQAVHAFCHALPQRWIQMTVTLSATSSLNWASKLCNAQSGVSFSQLAETADVDAAPVFLPYLNGERTPHNDANAKGMFFGLSSRTDTAALAYSVMEGVAFSLADGQAALLSAGTRLSQATAVGGGSNSAFWLRLLASCTGMVLVRPEGGDKGGAFGAARLARLATTGETVAAVCQPLPTETVLEPVSALTERLMPRYERYKALYRNTRHLLN